MAHSTYRSHGGWSNSKVLSLHKDSRPGIRQNDPLKGCFWGCFLTHLIPTLHKRVSRGAAQSQHKTPGAQGSVLDRAGPEQGAGRAPECTTRAKTPSGTIFVSSKLVAGGEIRSGRSWSCSHSLLLFRTYFFLEKARVPAAAPALRQLTSWAALEPDQGTSMCPHGCEMSVPLPRARAEQG